MMKALNYLIFAVALATTTTSTPLEKIHLNPFRLEPRQKAPANFRDIDCSSGAFDTRKTGAERWSTADTNDAWTMLNHWWTIIRDDEAQGKDVGLGNVKGFIPSTVWYMSNNRSRTHGTNPLGGCAIGGGDCTVDPMCDDYDYPSFSLIVTSWVRFHNFYTKMYEALGDATTDVSLNLKTFIDVFNPPRKKDVDILAIIFEDLVIATTFLASLAWIKVLALEKNVGDNVGNALIFSGSVKDFTGALVRLNGGNTDATAIGELDRLGDISAGLGFIVNQTQSAINSYVSEVFDGSDGSISRLTDIMNSGAWVEENVDDKNLFDMKNTLSTVLYSQLVPAAWSGDSLRHPVVIYADGSDLKFPPYDPNFIQSSTNDTFPQPFASVGEMPQEIADANRIPYGGTTLWLVDAHNCQNWDGFRSCLDNDWPGEAFRSLPGAEELVKGTFGGVHLNDMAISSFVGWQIIGKSNGYKIPPLSTQIGSAPTDQSQFVYRNGLQTPGLFSIPVCTYNEVRRGWTYGVSPGYNITLSCPFFPCCPEWNGERQFPEPTVF